MVANSENLLMKKTISRSSHPGNLLIKKAITRSSHQRCSIEIGAFKKLTKFTGKHLCQSLFFNKVADLGLHIKGCNFIKKEFCKIFKNTIFTEQLRKTASEYFIMSQCFIYFPGYPINNSWCNERVN